MSINHNMDVQYQKIFPPKEAGLPIAFHIRIHGGVDKPSYGRAVTKTKFSRLLRKEAFGARSSAKNRYHRNNRVIRTIGRIVCQKEKINKVRIACQSSYFTIILISHDRTLLRAIKYISMIHIIVYGLSPSVS